MPPSSHTSCSDGDSSGIEIRDEDRTNGQSEFHLGEGGIHPPPPLGILIIICHDTEVGNGTILVALLLMAVSYICQALRLSERFSYG